MENVKENRINNCSHLYNTFIHVLIFNHPINFNNLMILVAHSKMTEMSLTIFV